MGRGPLEKDQKIRYLASGLPVLTHGQDQGGTFTLGVRAFGSCFIVDVADHSPTIPVIRSVAVDMEHGRGLLLVAEIADSWGYFFEGGRKHVWFHLRIGDPRPPPDACQATNGLKGRTCGSSAQSATAIVER